MGNEQRSNDNNRSQNNSRPSSTHRRSTMGKAIKPNTFETFVGEPESATDLKRIIIIVNPVSGGKKGLKILKQIKPSFEAEGVSVKVIHTQHAGHAREIALQQDLSEIDALCAIGGDGTAHELVNGFLGRPENDEARERVAIGLIPGGSGNTLAYDLKLTSPQQFAKQLLAGLVRRCDAIKIVAGSSSSAKSKELVPQGESDTDPYPRICYGLNIVGWGLPAQVLKTANDLRWCGSAQYNLAAYSSLIKNVGYKGKLTLVDKDDKEIVVSDKFVMVQAQVTVHMGEKMPFAPRAKMDDGLMDLVTIPHTGRLSLINIMEKAKKGDHVKASGVKYYQCKSMVLQPDPKETFVGPRTVNVDGELIGAAPLTCTVLPKAVRFVTGE